MSKSDGTPALTETEAKPGIAEALAAAGDAPSAPDRAPPASRARSDSRTIGEDRGALDHLDQARVR